MPWDTQGTGDTSGARHFFHEAGLGFGDQPHLAVLCEPSFGPWAGINSSDRTLGTAAALGWSLGWIYRALCPLPSSEQRLFCFPSAVTSARGGSFLSQSPGCGADHSPSL